LVLTIVNQQLNGPINPIYKEPLLSMDKISLSEQSETLSESDDVLLESALLEDALFENELSLVSSAEFPNLSNKKQSKVQLIKNHLKKKWQSPL
jgi:hypothetical protein